MKPVTSYTGAHSRVSRVRGKASNYCCVECGGPARQWAFDHRDPDVQTGVTGWGREARIAEFSSNPWHYQPMCVKCHTNFDMREGGRQNNRQGSGLINGIKATMHLTGPQAAKLLKTSDVYVYFLRKKVRDAHADNQGGQSNTLTELISEKSIQ